MSKVIHMTLSTDSINAAIKELRDYQQWLVNKAEELRKRVGELIRDRADQGFSGAIVDVYTDGTEIAAEPVQVEVKSDGNITAVVATGEDVFWVEFGTGVHFNGSKGSSPNPLVAENGLPYVIGGYGQGRGGQDKWVFKGIGDELHWTYGTPAEMPMYKAEMGVAMDIVNIAREVFSS